VMGSLALFVIVAGRSETSEVVVLLAVRGPDTVAGTGATCKGERRGRTMYPDAACCTSRASIAFDRGFCAE